MGTETQHRAKAARNRAFAEKIGPVEYFDWYCIAQFYRAVHLVESGLARGGVHSKFHEERKAHITRHPRLIKVYDEYHALKNLSELARYGIDVKPPPDIGPFQRNIEAYVEAIEKCANECK